MTWLHATGVVIRDGHTTDEHPQVREVFQCLLGTTLTAQLKALGALR